MSVGDLYVGLTRQRHPPRPTEGDADRTGEIAVSPRRIRRRRATQHVAKPITDVNVGVPITVLTTDATLSEAISAAVSAQHPVSTASSLEEAIELAATGRCGVLITDQVSTQPVLRRTTQLLREHEPALVVIAVGNSGEQNSLISLLSAGVVDRLMLKPITPALAQIVLKSATQQHRNLKSVTPVRPTSAVLVEEQQESESSPNAVVVAEAHSEEPQATVVVIEKLALQPSPTEVVLPTSRVTTTAAPKGFDPQRLAIPRPSWLAVLAALAVIATLMAWMGSKRASDIDPHAVITTSLAEAQRALQEGHALEPRGHSAIDHYNTVLALDPANASAKQGIEQIADRFAAEAGLALARGQIAAAIVAIESMRRVRPDHRQLAELETQLAAAQEKYVVELQSRAAATIAQPPSTPAPPPPETKVASTTAVQSVRDSRVRAVSQTTEAPKHEQPVLAPSTPVGEIRTRSAPVVELVAMTEKEVQVATSPPSQAQVRENSFPGGAGIEAATPSPVASPPPQPVATAPAKLKVARLVRPEYPEDALIAGTEGWVNVGLSVTPAGDVVDPHVVSSSDSRLFDRAALSAVRKWKYEPFAANDPRTTQTLQVRLDFKLEGKRRR